MDNNKINEAALTKRIKTLVLQERFEEALKALDDIDVSRIKNISILCLVGEVYMGLGRFDEAEHVLLRVYEKQPNTRRILDLLTTLYIDKGEYSEAEYYYKEFIGVASRDLHRYILRYRLDKGKGERLSVLIDTLEKLKDYEYIEEWAYELATLYDASGEKKKCIHECDEIVLWFGHGEYVDKAIALKCKLTGEPLPEMTTVEMHQAEEARLAEEERLAAGHTAETDMANGEEGDYLTDDYEDSIDVGLIQRVLDEKSSHNDDGEETPADSSKSDADLLADQIRDDDEPLDDAAAENMLAAKELIEDVAGDDESVEDEAAEDEILPELAEAEEDGEDEEAEEDEKSHIASLFSALMFGKAKDKNKEQENDKDEDQDQIYKVIEDMKTETVPEEMEDTDILGQLIGEGTIQIDDTNFVEDDGEDEDEFVEDDEVIDDEDDEVIDDEAEEDDEAIDDEDDEMIDDDDGEDDEMINDEDDEDDGEEDEDDDYDDEDDEDDDYDEEDEDEIIGDMEASLDMFFVNADSANASDITDAADDSNAADVLNGDDEDESEDDEDEDEDEDEISDDIKASDTVLDIFGSVTGVKSIKSQLAKTFTKFEDSTLDSMDLLAPYDINFVVTGYDMSVKSQIAIGIAKALNTYGICDKNKLVRATADDLNGRDFTMIFGKLKGGCLIIEGADRLNEQAAGIIADFVQQENQDVAIVLEGEEERIKALFKKYPVLHSKFLNIIHIGKYNENELVQLAVGYAKKKGYDLSKPAAAILKRMLRERMRDEYSVNYEDIMAIIEEAIASLEKRNMKNLFMTVLDNKYEEAAMFELLPEDFDNINIPD